MRNIERLAMAYANAKPFLDELKRMSNYLTIQQMRTLKGQALAGDVTGAFKDLAKLAREMR